MSESVGLYRVCDKVLVDEQRLAGVAGRGVVRLGVHHQTHGLNQPTHKVRKKRLR